MKMPNPENMSLIRCARLPDLMALFLKSDFFINLKAKKQITIVVNLNLEQNTIYSVTYTVTKFSYKFSNLSLSYM